jgi:hypothetical protein
LLSVVGTTYGVIKSHHQHTKQTKQDERDATDHRPTTRKPRNLLLMQKDVLLIGRDWLWKEN